MHSRWTDTSVTRGSRSFRETSPGAGIAWVSSLPVAFDAGIESFRDYDGARALVGKGEWGNRPKQVER